MPYVRKRKRKSKKSLKKTMMLCGVLTIVCFLIAGILFFLVGKIPDFEQGIINSAIVTEAERALGRKLTDEDRDGIEKKYGIANDKGIMEKVRKALRER